MGDVTLELGSEFLTTKSSLFLLCHHGECGDDGYKDDDESFHSALFVFCEVLCYLLIVNEGVVECFIDVFGGELCCAVWCVRFSK